MGAATARITEEDFLTPPELRGLRLAASPVGQVGGVRMELVVSGGRTRLGECYQQVPLHVLPPFHFAGEGCALLYLLVPTVGLLDGDAHFIDVVARAGTRTVLTGQSANRIHPARTSYATQQWRARVEDDAVLVVLPGPAIPYRGCRYFQHAVIDLAPGARLIWGDIWLPGRYARDEGSEFYVFDRLVQHLEVRRDGELVYRDRFDWRGPWTPQTARWHLGDGAASGSLLVTGPMTVESPGLALASGDTLVRKCGSPSEVVRELVDLALEQAGAWTGGQAWLVASGNFGPNHWFSPIG